MFSRRSLLSSASMGFGWLAFECLFGSRAAADAPRRPTPRIKARAKSVILCYMSGAFSHVDSFDPKPRLTKMAGQPMPMPVQATMFDNVGTIMPSPWKFRRRGQSGLPISDLFPNIARMADDICVVRSMTSKASEHAQANFFFHTGFSFQGYPSAGAWMNYGLGSESSDLPGYVVLRSGKAVDPIGGQAIYGSGFLPAVHQASVISADQDPALPNLRPFVSSSAQRKMISAMRGIDHAFLAHTAPSPLVEAAIANYETAFRMQSAVPDVCDLSRESAATISLYGVDSSDETQSAYARQCLVARRLVERGVRFVELSCLPRDPAAAQAANPWDQHDSLRKGHADMARQVDRPIAALVEDLKSRGLLDQTIVLFAGEFGRTPFAQGTDGRDHNPFGFSLWLAGGGFKRGVAHGATDEFGYYAVEEVMDIYDLWATIQHQLGIDHEKLTYHFGGRDFRLSDVEGQPRLALVE